MSVLHCGGLLADTSRSGLAFTVSDPAADADETYVFTYVRMGRTRFMVSYWGDKQNNIEDFQGLIIKLKGFVYQVRSV